MATKKNVKSRVSKRLHTVDLTKDQILTFLKKHKPYLKEEFGVTQIALFGSYARGEQLPTSDVDVLVETKIHDFRNRMRLQDFLEKKLKKKVDVLYFSAVRKFIMRQIQEEMIHA